MNESTAFLERERSKYEKENPVTCWPTCPACGAVMKEHNKGFCELEFRQCRTCADPAVLSIRYFGYRGGYITKVIPQHTSHPGGQCPQFYKQAVLPAGSGFEAGFIALAIGYYSDPCGERFFPCFDGGAIRRFRTEEDAGLAACRLSDTLRGADCIFRNQVPRIADLYVSSFRSQHPSRIKETP